jgi:hypothetical protein
MPNLVLSGTNLGVPNAAVEHLQHLFINILACVNTSQVLHEVLPLHPLAGMQCL